MDNLTLSYIIIYVFVFIFGACIGSFLNVCIYRLPKNESLIKRNSHCMTCGEPIKRRDLIPIVSWCILRGKCRSCGAKISARYTIVETLNALLYLWVFYHFKWNFQSASCSTCLSVILCSYRCILHGLGHSAYQHICCDIHRFAWCCGIHLLQRSDGTYA